MHDILNAARNGVNKTRIVYSVNINFNLLKKYLPKLMKHGQIEAHTGSIIYKTTDKELEFLEI